MFVKRQTPSLPLFYSLNILKIEDLCTFELAKFIFKLKNVPDFNYMHNLTLVNQSKSTIPDFQKTTIFYKEKKLKSVENIGIYWFKHLASFTKCY